MDQSLKTFLVKIFSYALRLLNETSMIDFVKYKKLLARMESSDNYKAVNSFSNALGKYQFIPTTLNSLQSIYNLPPWVDAGNFLNNPSLQELYIDALIKDTLELIGELDLSKYLGMVITGRKRFANKKTKVNIYGLLAGAHLAGVGSLKRYFVNGVDPDDGKTSLSDYVYYFSNNLNGGSEIFYSVGLGLLVFYLLY